DGKISESKFDYEAEDGSLKSANEEYNKNMKDKAGVSAGEAIEQLNAALVKEQDLSAVEVVSGATQTSEDFKKSTEALLAAAAEGNTETVNLD
ncbi:FMN-binding protein, partial [Streptococcus suis]